MAAAASAAAAAIVWLGASLRSESVTRMRGIVAFSLWPRPPQR